MAAFTENDPESDPPSDEWYSGPYCRSDPRSAACHQHQALHLNPLLHLKLGRASLRQLVEGPQGLAHRPHRGVRSQIAAKARGRSSWTVSDVLGKPGRRPGVIGAIDASGWCAATVAPVADVDKARAAFGGRPALTATLRERLLLW